MIDIDFTNPIDKVRINIGDVDREWVSDGTINSALTAFSENLFTTSVALMEMLKVKFATLADEEQVGELKVKYTKLFERYSQVLDEFKAGTGGGIVTPKAFMPIIIGGTSKSAKKAIYDNADAFSMYDLADWHNLQVGNKSLYEMLTDDIEHAYNLY